MWKPLFVWKARTLWAIYEKKKCKKKWIAPERFHILFYYYRFYHLQGLGVVPALLPGFFGPKVVLHPGQVAGFRGSYRLFRSERIAHAMWFESGQCLVWFRVVHVTSPGAACCPTWWLPACCKQQEGLKRFFLSGKRRNVGVGLLIYQDPIPDWFIMMDETLNVCISAHFSNISQHHKENTRTAQWQNVLTIREHRELTNYPHWVFMNCIVRLANKIAW